MSGRRFYWADRNGTTASISESCLFLLLSTFSSVAFLVTRGNAILQFCPVHGGRSKLLFRSVAGCLRRLKVTEVVEPMRPDIKGPSPIITLYILFKLVLLQKLLFIFLRYRNTGSRPKTVNTGQLQGLYNKERLLQVA